MGVRVGVAVRVTVIMVVIVRVGMARGVLGCFGQGQFPRVDALQPSQRGSELSQLSARPLENDHLHAAIVIEVNVHRRDHLPGVPVLQLKEFLDEVRPVVIVNQREGRGHGPVVALEGVACESLPQQLADGLAAGRERAVANKHIERFEKVGFQRHGKTGELGHGGGSGD